ncbi:MAG: hypothetical protein U1E21_23040 [Reyranellaceae bacterium]
MPVAQSAVASLLARFAFVVALATATPLSAQGIPGVSQGPKLGEMEIKAYQKIPKTKVAVQLTSDTHLSRELRRQVMVRLSQRGNEVGFSGGNVMRMDVTFIDLSGGANRGQGTIGGQPDYAPPGSNPRMELPSNPLGRRDGVTAPPSAPTLRLTLTLYTVDGGKVLWAATGSCATQAERAERVGEALINRIFDNADRSMTGDAGC